MGHLMGTSTKAIQGYEQGWRRIPTHVERHLLFLVSRAERPKGKAKACWTIKKCPPSLRQRCPAWEFQTGDLCWFINGTICRGQVQRTWPEKMALCRRCEVLQELLPHEVEEGLPDSH